MANADFVIIIAETMEKTMIQAQYDYQFYSYNYHREIEHNPTGHRCWCYIMGLKETQDILHSSIIDKLVEGK